MNFARQKFDRNELCKDPFFQRQQDSDGLVYYSLLAASRINMSENATRVCVLSYNL